MFLSIIKKYFWGLRDGSTVTALSAFVEELGLITTILTVAYPHL